MICSRDGCSKEFEAREPNGGPIKLYCSLSCKKSAAYVRRMMRIGDMMQMAKQIRVMHSDIALLVKELKPSMLRTDVAKKYDIAIEQPKRTASDLFAGIDLASGEPSNDVW
jgi:hypothetical protein